MRISDIKQQKNKIKHTQPDFPASSLRLNAAALWASMVPPAILLQQQDDKGTETDRVFRPTGLLYIVRIYSM
jgi:hypothetical protein